MAIFNNLGFGSYLMAYEIEYFQEQEDGWNVLFEGEFVEKRVEFARIVSDTMDEVGLAIDEIDWKWPGGPVDDDLSDIDTSNWKWIGGPVDDDLSDIRATCGGLELLPGPNGGKIARQLFSGFLPTRVRGRWQVYWGRILW